MGVGCGGSGCWVKAAARLPILFGVADRAPQDDPGEGLDASRGSVVLLAQLSHHIPAGGHLLGQGGTVIAGHLQAGAVCRAIRGERPDDRQPAGL